MKSFNGLYCVHLELSSRCNKKCWMCGRREIDRDYPEIRINYGDMDIYLAKKIISQLPENIVIQFHNNGEPLLYNLLEEILIFSKKQIRCMDTNGKLLIEKADEIIDNLETITISVIELDKEGDEQYEIVKKFIELKGNKKPRMVYRLLGDITKKLIVGIRGQDVEYNDKRRDRWYRLPGTVVTRTLHSPLGSYNYEKKVTIPEIGICLEILNHLAINIYGEVFPCVRFDPLKLNKIGDVNKDTLVDIWNGKARKRKLELHILGRRDLIPFCNKCEYWGVPLC